MIKDILNLALIQNTIRTATPLILAGLGGLLTMHAGILNIGMEGMILIGAFFGVLGSYFFASSFMGVIMAIISGIVMGFLFGFFVIELKADEFIIGIAINIFAGGLTVFLLRSIFGVKGAFSSPDIKPLPDVALPFIGNIEFLDTILNNHSIFVYISWILTIIIFIFLYKTPYGFWLRASGEHPQSLETAGVSPKKMKYMSSVMCGVFCGMAGAHLSLGYLTLFTENMSAGRGFIALAAIIFGAYNPAKTFAAALLFGFFDALGIRLQSVGIPSQFTQMIPYLATIAVLFIVVQRKNAKGLMGLKDGM
ncbi:nucleoside ABC transporter membrane protein [Peptoclostridium litorale DSM 5388]|uniref:Inner-membrane translocator n=1 Tax=Peptoclostridium litorale DSM 5388 TaxID=1121324 RepID=A0A069RD73_PEPLI|nr:ABC transporter permease [Peptoclostridium litorale]KDR94991.1 inner-membrane translocator [Peptoclostridium litorale DSM 5388]SIN76935.1 nucleoside ABC transporter membrane protein [Peptoclostridium litorale DSM 5388]